MSITVKLDDSTVITITIDGPSLLTVHASAAQVGLNVRQTFGSGEVERLHNPTTPNAELSMLLQELSVVDGARLVDVIAHVAYAQGKSAGGVDGSEVIVTAPHYYRREAKVTTRYMGATALLHYSTDTGGLYCGGDVPRIRALHGAANVFAAILEGAALCPECVEMHTIEASMQARAVAKLTDAAPRAPERTIMEATRPHPGSVDDE